MEEGNEVTRQQGNKSHGRQTARIEVPLEILPRMTSPEMHARILERFQAIGYDEVTFDPRGLRSGSLNETISVNITGNLVAMRR